MSKKKKLKVFGNIIKYVPWVLHPFIYRPLKAIRTFLMKRGIISDAERQIQHLTFVASTLIERHYKNALLPPEELRLHVGTTGTAANFWAQGINSSQRILEIFGDCPTKPILDWGCGSGRLTTNGVTAGVVALAEDALGFPVLIQRLPGHDVAAV